MFFIQAVTTWLCFFSLPRRLPRRYVSGFRPRFDCTHQHNLYRFFLLSLLQPLAAMGKHLAPSEQDLINRLSRKNGADFVSRALAAVNKARRRQGQDALTRSPIYRYTKGMTHKRAAKEKRGRKKIPFTWLQASVLSAWAGGEARSLSQLPDGALQYPVPGPMGPNAPGPGRGAWARGLGPCVRARARGPGRLHLGSHCWKYTFLYVKLKPVQ